MNKKILKTVKVILWGLVYTLPLWHFLLSINAGINTTFGEVMNNYMLRENFISDVLYEIFGYQKIVSFIPLGTGVTNYLAYFVFVTFAHICIDIILFLPDCARYIFDKMTGEKDEDSL